MSTKSLQSQAIMYILNIYDYVASTASTGKGIEELNRLFSYEDDSNYMLQNIMMEENHGNFNRFSRKVEKLYDRTEINMIKHMIGMIVRKYYLNHDIILTGNALKFADKFFGVEERKNLQLVQAKNRIVKK